MLKFKFPEFPIYHLFQPLYKLDNWKLYGYEAFLRTPNFSNPQELFSIAKEENRLYETDTYSLREAVSSFFTYNKKKNLPLFVNVFPSTLLHPSFYDFWEQTMKQVKLLNNQIVFEINESEEVKCIPSLKEAVLRLQKRGHYIALDDIGKGSMSLEMLVELEPDFFKLDCYFSRELFSMQKKQNVVELLTRFAKKEGIHLILEGIETPEDLAIAKFIGVEVGQGYLLGQPSILENLIVLT